MGRIHSLEHLSCILGLGVGMLAKAPVSLLQEAHQGPHSQLFCPPGSLQGSGSRGSSFSSRLKAAPVYVTHLPFLPAWWLFIHTCVCVCVCVCV